MRFVRCKMAGLGDSCQHDKFLQKKRKKVLTKCGGSDILSELSPRGAVGSGA